MNTRVIMTVTPAAVVGGIILLLGCGAESKKPGASNRGPVIITANAAPQTNAPAPPAEPFPAIATAPAKLSPNLEEIVQLAQAGLGDDVLLAYVENSKTSYKLEIEEILYLHDLGISAEVIAALVRRGESSTEQAPALAGPPSQSLTPAENANTNPPPAVEAEPSTDNAYAVTPPVQQVTHNYFYQTLSPYGTWIDVPSYGWCWQPTVAVVDVGWRPYSDRGRWLWSDCGWYWQSDYAWGWGPFHYGRWHRSPAHGWVWLPGTVWAPAWVSWRYSDAYCGWAPLPPGAHFEAGFGFRFHGGLVGVGFDFGLGSDCFTFIPTARFCDRTPWHYRLPHTQVVNIFNRTTIINNYTGGPNRTVVNLGPGENAIASVSRNEIRKVTLRDVNPNGGRLIKSDRLDQDGRTLAVFRPQLPEQASAPPPEITRRQQELRAKTDTLVNSDVMRVARADAERRSAISPTTRGFGRTTSPELRGPGLAPRPTVPATGTYAPRTESRKNDSEPNRNTVETTGAPVPPAISRNPRSEARNAGQSSPANVRTSRQEREARSAAGIAPNTVESIRPGNNSRSAAIQPRQEQQPEFRPQPGRRPESIADEQPQFRSQSPPAISPAFRQESRRAESRTPTFPAQPAYGQPAGQSITPPPTAIQPRQPDPRFNAPAYRPPQNNYSPPPAAPRVYEAPAARPSSPPPSHSPPPAVSRPAPSSPPPASRPSSPPSQSRGESRKR